MPAIACPRGNGRGPDCQAVRPAPAGIQKPYRPWQIALEISEDRVRHEPLIPPFL